MYRHLKRYYLYLCIMMKQCFIFFFTMVLLSVPFVANAEGTNHKDHVIKALLLPQKKGGMPFFETVVNRKTTRMISETPLSTQMLSNLLYVAFGVTREDGKRTVPSALDKRTASIYVAMADGVWVYNPPKHQLEQVSDKTLKSEIGLAPLELIYAAPDNETSAMLIGSIYQNVGLFCASEGLASYVRGSKVSAITGLFPLTPGYKIYVSQGIGFPQ